MKKIKLWFYSENDNIFKKQIKSTTIILFSNYFSGIITDMRVTHATPAALYAHTQDRSWETDSVIPKKFRDCEDITKQLVYRLILLTKHMP